MNEQHEIRSDELADIAEAEEALAGAPELDPLDEAELENWYQAFITAW
jgi:hypothetical protein